MQVARFDEEKKMAILNAMVQIQDEARLKGYAVPVATKAMYGHRSDGLPVAANTTN
jgi:hypothetical protein